MKSVTAREIYEFCREKDPAVRYVGDYEISVKGFSSLSHYRNHTLTWVKKQSNYEGRKDVAPSICIIQEGVKISDTNQIISADSRNLFFYVIEEFWGNHRSRTGSIGEYTHIGSNVCIGERVTIGNCCSIDGDISIGDDTVISDNVVIKNRVDIGSRCRIQALAVIGENGFGWTEDKDNKKKMIEHYGGVLIGNDVFIGSHVNIARGVIDDTIISDGVKIAPSTHIGHNNYVGEDAVIICSQLYGSAHTGDNAYIVGSIIRNHSVIGASSMVGMGSIVTKDVDPGTTVVGNPAEQMQRK